MLDPRKCFAILKHVVTTMQSEEEFNLLEWDIQARLRPLGKDTDGLCEIQVPYRKAFITIDPEQCETYEGLYETSVHEMFHVVLATLLILENGKTTNQTWDYALEPCIVKLERFYTRNFKKFENYFTDEGDFKPEQP